jgi:hypothetical protein
MSETYPSNTLDREEQHGIKVEGNIDEYVQEVMLAKEAAVEMHEAIISYRSNNLDADSLVQLILRHMDNSVIVKKLEDRRVNKLHNMVIQGLSADQRKIRIQSEIDILFEESNLTSGLIERLNNENRWIDTMDTIIRSVDNLERSEAQDDLNKLLEYGLKEVRYIFRELQSAINELKEFDYNFNPDNLPQHRYFSKGEENFLIRKELLERLDYCQRSKDTIFTAAVNAKKTIEGSDPVIDKAQLNSISEFINVFMQSRKTRTDNKIQDLNTKATNIANELRLKSKELHGIVATDKKTENRLRAEFNNALENIDKILLKLITS